MTEFSFRNFSESRLNLGFAIDLHHLHAPAL
jgi:hypothetical protein